MITEDKIREIKILELHKNIDNILDIIQYISIILSSGRNTMSVLEGKMRDEIHVITDSLSCVSETEYIKVTDTITVRHGDLEWYDGEKSTAEMVEMINKSGKLPTTSQPPLGEVIELFTQLAKDGKKVPIFRNGTWAF